MGVGVTVDDGVVVGVGVGDIGGVGVGVGVGEGVGVGVGELGGVLPPLIRVLPVEKRKEYPTMPFPAASSIPPDGKETS